MHRLMVLVIAAAVFAGDWEIKHLVFSTMAIGQSIAVIPGVLWITYILNSGAAFGVLRHGAPLFIVIALGLLAVVAVVLARTRRLPGLTGWGLGLLTGGTVGNLWDRVIMGRVIDYIHFRGFAIFNLADASIVVGIGLMLLEYWQRERQAEAGMKGRHGR